MTMNPKRFIWKNGLPVFDILKALIPGGSAQGEFSNVSDDMLQEMLNSREDLRAKLSVVSGRIENWGRELSLLEVSIKNLPEKLINSVVYDDTDGIDVLQQHGASVKKIRYLTELIELSSGELNRLKAELEILDKDVSKEFHKFETVARSKAEKEISEHVSAIKAIAEKFTETVTKVSNDLECQGNLRPPQAFDLPPYLVGGYRRKHA